MLPNYSINNNEIYRGPEMETRVGEFSGVVAPIVAVTIGCGSRAFRVMAKHAAKSCRKSTNLPVFILDDLHLKSQVGLQLPHHIKYRLFDIFPNVQRILYFDADTLFLSKIKIESLFDDAKFVCVKDQINSWSIGDSKAVGVPLDEYFNSGFFLAERNAHEKMFKFAESLVGKLPSILKDQGYFNAARLQLNIPVKFLPVEYNWCDFSIRELAMPYVAHFNGSGNLPIWKIRLRRSSIILVHRCKEIAIGLGIGLKRLRPSDEAAT